MTSPTRSAFVLALLAAAAGLFAACQSGGGNAASTGCAGLSACCRTLTGTDASACSEVANTPGVSDATCSSELSALQSTGGCQAAAPPSPSTSATTICSLYVDCEGKVDPAGQAVILAAYGPSGTCWETSATTEECGTACQSGLQAAHDANPTECPMCGSSADCSGTTPVCSSGDCTCIAFGDSCTTSGTCCSGLCTNGTCGCPAGQTYCGDPNPVLPNSVGENLAFGCVDVNEDLLNCGACGNACPESATACTKGVCGCGPSTAFCSEDEHCTDLTSDMYNCGACGKTCHGAQDACVDGKCGCAVDETLCGETCVNLFYDANNCGACGVSCGYGMCNAKLCSTVVGASNTTGTCAEGCAALGEGFSCTSATFTPSAASYGGCPSQVTSCSSPQGDAPGGCLVPYDLDCECSHS